MFVLTPEDYCIRFQLRMSFPGGVIFITSLKFYYVFFKAPVFERLTTISFFFHHLYINTGAVVVQYLCLWCKFRTDNLRVK